MRVIRDCRVALRFVLAAEPFHLESQRSIGLKVECSRNLVIAGWNVRQGGTSRARQIGEALSSAAADVVVIGEYRASGPLDDELRALGYKHITASRREYGVAVASKLPHSPCDLMEFFRRHDDRFVAVRLNHFTLVGTYFPLQRAVIPLWESILEMALLCKDRPVLLMGDLNSGSHYADEQEDSLPAADLFDRLSGIGWVDLWRRQHGDKREFTWFSNHGNGFRLDHAFSSPALAGRVVRCEYSHAERIDRISDHSMQIVEVATDRG
jgi:exonuclease III